MAASVLSRLAMMILAERQKHQFSFGQKKKQRFISVMKAGTDDFPLPLSAREMINSKRACMAILLFLHVCFS
jgi:hypothetical protein